MKKGLIMEGGGLRGLFTCGVIDVLMENGIEFDGAIGVSAGAAFGCNYKSKQIGRPYRYNKRYCRDKRYCSISSWIKTGDMFGAEFCYNTLPFELDIWDHETYQNNPMDFYVVCTDVVTGKALYKKLESGMGDDLHYIRASASMPIVSRLVEVDGYTLMDGGVADSIPVKYFESIGYDRNVVILTQPEEYVKGKNKLMPLIKISLKKYPNAVQAMADRHIKYNEDYAYIREKEKSGEMFVIRPPEALGISRTEKNPDELERAYQIGRKTAEEALDELKKYLGIPE